MIRLWLRVFFQKCCIGLFDTGQLQKILKVMGNHEVEKIMDLYKFINRYFIYPLYYFKNKDRRLQRLKEIESTLQLEKIEVEKNQLESLKAIIKYAYQHTPYYRKLMDDEGINPDSIRSFSDIHKIPLLSKKDIQDNCDQMISDEYDKSDLRQDSSGGSTGEPTIFYRTLENLQLRAADQIRHDKWSGWDIGERMGLVWGAQRDLSASKSMKEFILSRYIARIWELDAFEMTEQKMLEYTHTLEKIQPKMILGYANALVEFSKYLLKHQPNHTISLRGIVSSAETLTEEKRELIEQAFKCKVLNRYGSREVGLIASECKQQSGLHINSDSIYLEIVKSGQPVLDGESGDILITDLTNKAMPLIRYKLGDVGRKSTQTCQCGNPLPLLDKVEGRTGDFFVTSQGSLVHGEYFTHLFYGIDEVIQFQVIQETLQDITLKLVTKAGASCASYIDEFKQKTNEILNNNCNFDVQFVDKIEPTKTGKLLFTISKVNN